MAAAVAVGGIVLAAGAGPHLLLGSLLGVIAYGVVFHGPRAAGGVAAIVVVAGVALGATTELGAAPALAWLAPPVLATGLVGLSLARARRARSEAQRAHAESLRLADEDGVTGLANYRAFWRTLSTEAARADRHDQTFSLVVLDLDDFKRINDEHGHLTGDAVLRAVAEALRRAVRAEDVVCRQGGDEFAVVAVASGAREAPVLAERLLAAVEAVPVGGDVPRRLTAGAGYASFGQPARSPEALVEGAEVALLKAKQDRRARALRTDAADAVRSAGASSLRVRSPAFCPTALPSVRLAVIAQLARALAGATSDRAIAETVIAYAAGAVDAERVAMLRRAQTDGSLAMVAVSGGRGASEPRQVERSPAVPTALAEGRATLAAADADLRGRARLRRGGVLAVPLMVGASAWGVLELRSRHEPAFSPAEIEVVEAMAETAARALGVLQVLAQLAGGAVDESSGCELADGHGREVARLSSRVGRRLGLSSAELRQLGIAALFHEIGTVCAPPDVLRKPGQLTDEEFASLRPHPLIGHRLLVGLPGLREAAGIVRAARERWDGEGYPEGLAGHRIPLAARVLHTCDAFVAMTSERPYRPALSPGVALAELRRNSSTQFDPDVVAALLSEVEPQPVPAEDAAG